jgi:hypothetical protein
MENHLYKRIKICPATYNNIELTDEIKKHILENRIYRIPKKITNISKPENNNEEYHYIYIIRPKENVLHDENVYKIGKTKLKNLELNISRLTSYGKGSEFIYISQCSDCDILERAIIDEFDKKFDKYTFGNEYYVGDKYEMIKTIGELLLKYI